MSTVGALVFRNTEQTVVEQLRQGEVLRMNRNHLLTRNSFTGSTGLTGNSGGPAGPRRRPRTTLRRRCRIWTPPGFRSAVRRKDGRCLSEGPPCSPTSATPVAPPGSCPSPCRSVYGTQLPASTPRLGRGPTLATACVRRNSRNRSRCEARTREDDRTHQRRGRRGP